MKQFIRSKCIIQFAIELSKIQPIKWIEKYKSKIGVFETQ